MPLTADVGGAADVSVVIALHDRLALIGQTLDSLAAELHPEVRLEVIVVDDGSVDGGAELVADQYPRVQLLRQQRQGAPAARNRGIAAAAAPVLLLLDSDDLVEPGFFEPRLRALGAAPRADGAYGPWTYFEGEGAFAEAAVRSPFVPYPIEPQLEWRSHMHRLLGGWYVAPHAIAWRTSAVRRVGGQDTALRVNQDVDLMFRILCTGSGVVGCAAPRALYRHHAGPRQGMVGADARKAEEILALRRRFLGDLRAAGRLDEAAHRELGRYCFDQWDALRDIAPDVAAGLLAFSRELHPGLQLRGRWPLRALSRLVGPSRALVLRRSLARLRQRVA